MRSMLSSFFNQNQKKMKPSSLLFVMLLFAGSIITGSCTKIVAKATGYGRTFPGMSPKVLKKISKETGVPEAHIVYPDMIAGSEIMEEINKEQSVFPFVFLLDSTHHQLALPDTFTANKCSGLLQKYLKSEEIGLNKTDIVRKGGFYHPLDSTIHYQFTPGKEQLVLVYMYEVGRAMKGFYKSMSRHIAKKPDNREIWLVVLSRKE